MKKILLPQTKVKPSLFLLSIIILLCFSTTGFAQVEKPKEKPVVKEKPVPEKPAQKEPVKEQPPKAKPPQKEKPAQATAPAEKPPAQKPPKPEPEEEEEEAPSFDNTIAYDSEEGSPPASIHDVAWISGNWSGAAFGGTFEEIWSEPFGNSMMGMFKLVVRGRVQFYEMMTISEEKGTLILRLKHFEPDMKGWEEKNETIDFPLVKIYDDVVFFDQFTFEKTGEDELTVYLVIEDKDGKKEEVTFSFKQ